MSASDSNGFFVELGEYNIVIARAATGQRPRTIEAIQEIWLGDTAGTDTALSELRPAGSTAKTVALLRLKAHSTFLATPDQAKSITTPSAIDGFLNTALAAENRPASWAWCGANNGLAPQNGARWALNAAAASTAEEAVGKLRDWSFELVRCQSAPLTLAGALSTAVQSGSVLLLEISEQNTTLLAIGNQGINALTTIPVGFDALAGATQTTLGLKFRGSAARLMFNESYDFADAANSIIEPLANAVRGALGSLGNPAPTQIVCGGILGRQTWIHQALAKALNLTPFAFDAAAWAGTRGISFGSGVTATAIAPSWLGVLNAIAAHENNAPAGTKAWQPLLSGTPIAAAPAVPAIIAEPAKAATPPPAVTPAIIQEPAKPTPPPTAKPAVIPAIIQEPAKPTPPPATKPAVTPAIIQEPAKPTPPPTAKPAVIPAIIQEPAKPTPPTAAAAKPVTPATPPKPSVIITPPTKPAEPPKPAVIPAKPGAPAASSPAKPAETKPAVQATAKPTATPAPAKPTPVPAAKAVAKPEPTKPAAAAKPAPAPVLGAKPATAAPFPPKKSNKMMVIGIVAAVIIGIVVFFVIDSSNKAKAEQAQNQLRIKQEAEAKIKAESLARAAAEKKAEEERLARQQELQKAEMQLKNAQEEARKQQEEARKILLYGRGNLELVTEPTGATVTVGELSPKPTPLSMKDLRLGTYDVTISLAGYDTERRSVEIKDKETTNLGTIALKRQIGTVNVNSTPSNLPFEIKPAGALFTNPNDVRTGKTPTAVTDLPIGSYQITITRANWPVYTSTFTVERNGSVTVNSDFPGATVTITSTPTGATVLRDNQVSVGTTPLTLTDVQPGNISFTLNRTGYEPQTVSGKAEGNKTLMLNASLTESDRIVKQSELDERPTPILQADPDLSAELRFSGGSALISLIIGRDGKPSDLKIEQQSSPTYGKACLIAASKWRFKPGIANGKPVRTRASIPFKIGGE